jgi:hypothetical protein
VGRSLDENELLFVVFKSVPADLYTAVCNFSKSKKGASVCCGLPFQFKQEGKIESLQSPKWHIQVLSRGERE